jgi:hypothetical protein
MNERLSGGRLAELYVLTGVDATGYGAGMIVG